MTQQPLVLKIGGNNLDEAGFVEALAQTVAQSHVPIVVVHGGGKEISQLQHQLGLTPAYIDGLRVTDDAGLAVVQMVLGGIVNQRIVHTLQKHGVIAQGLSGIDQGFMQAQKRQHPQGDLGHVGEVTHVKAEVIHTLLAQGITPVIAPLCAGEHGVLNVNADHVAGAVAQAIGASGVVFITNVAGVLNNNQLIEELTPKAAETFMQANVIYGGMLPKVKTALQLLAWGIPQVLITNLNGVLAGTGTAIVAQSSHSISM